MARHLPIDDQLETAAQLAIRSRVFFDLWWYLEGADTRPKIINTMRDYPQFFVFDAHAHFVAFILHLAALFEERGDTINLPRLAIEVRELAGRGEARSEELVHVDGCLAQAAGVARKVTILRSNLFAHRSATLTYAQAFKLADVTANEVRDLADLALRIANDLRVARGLDQRFPNPHPLHDARKLLAALSPGMFQEASVVT